MCAYNPNAQYNYWANGQRWAQHAAENGVPYWQNLDTGESVWQMPDGLRQAMGQVPMQNAGGGFYEMPGIYNNPNDGDDPFLEYTLRLSLVELQNSTAAAAAIPTPTPTPTPAAPVRRTPTPTPRPGPSQVREGREKNIFEKLDVPPRNPVRAHMADPGPARGTCAMCSSDTEVQSAPCGCIYCSRCIVKMFMHATKRETYQPLKCCRIEFPTELTDTAFAQVDAARNAAGVAAPAEAAAATGQGKGKGRNWKLERKSRVQRTFDCVACMESFVLDDVMVTPGCSHSYCRRCMNRLFVESAKSEDLYPPSCCKQAIPITWANLVLNTEEQNQFYAKSEEWKTPNRLYCSRRACSAFIPPLRVNADYGTCAKCLARTCAHCKGAFHSGEACPKDKATQDVLNLAQTAGWKKCFSCNMMVELGSGCNHITCRCGAEFCYTCGVKWKECDCQIWIAENLRRAVAEGEIPQVAMPPGAIRLGHMPAGVIPLEVVPAGAIPIGALPAGAIPLGAVPAGVFPIGIMPAGVVPLGVRARAVRIVPAHGGGGGGGGGGGVGGAPAGMEVPRIFVNRGGHIQEIPRMRVEVQGNMPMFNVHYNAPDGRGRMWDAVNGRWLDL